MRILALLFVILALTGSCETAQYDPEQQLAAVCGAKDPLKDLGWLKKQVEDFKRTSALGSSCGMVVWQVTYQGQVVFYIEEGGAACCGCGGTLYNCAGEVIKSCVLMDDAYSERKLLGKYNW
jgi:hypothetical protein